MLPEILTLKGFISYRERAVLDFSKFHIALISGENGQGKSSLLDAITFALFSIARGVEGNKKGMGELVTNGESLLSVAFKFYQNSEHYSVTRMFDRKKNASNVMLEMEKDGKFVNISENSIRETDEKIQEILKMNYETFVTSSFILQGKSDYFTAMSPTEKIEILREVLLLNVYEKARDRTREKIREIAVQKDNALRSIKGIQEELLKKENVESQFSELSEKKEALSNEVNSLNRNLLQLQKSFTTREKLKSKKEELLKAIARNRESIKEKEGRLKETERKIDELKALLVKKVEIVKSYNELLSSEEIFNKLLEVKLQVEELKRSKIDILGKIEKEKATLSEKIIAKEKSKENLVAKQKLLEREIKDLEGKIVEYKESLVKINGELSKVNDRLSELNIALEEARKRKSVKDLLLSEKGEIEKLRIEREKLVKREIKEKSEELRSVSKRISMIDLEALESNLNKKSDYYLALKKESDEREEEFQSLKEEEGIALNEVVVLERHFGEIKKKIDLLGVSTGGNCPLCGSPLDEVHRGDILIDLNTSKKDVLEKISTRKEEIAQIRIKLSKLKRVSQEDLHKTLEEFESLHAEFEQKKREKADLIESEKVLKEAIIELQKNLENLLTEEEQAHIFEISEKLKALEGIEVEIEKTKKDYEEETLKQNEISSRKEETLKQISSFIARMEQDAEFYKRNKSELEEIESEISDLKSTLASEEFMKALKEALLGVEKSLKEIAFDEEAFNEVKKKKNTLSKVREQYNILKEADVNIENYRNNKANTLKDIEKLEVNIEEDTRSLNAVENDLDAYKDLDSSIESTKKALDEKSLMLKEASENLVRLEEALKQLKAKEEEKKKAELFVLESKEQIKILNVCDDMFGKEGIPIALIRSILPEIERLSNDLLLRMSNGSMQLKFNTLHDTKSGERTTLQINVYDNGERRRYELFSGGEQFRINLAIRVGISLFLSQIAKAPLEMLVIDEGFGSQDETGKERVLNEINAIKDQFKKVIVITHMSDIKESFPYEIRVVKDSRGSRLFVV